MCEQTQDGFGFFQREAQHYLGVFPGKCHRLAAGGRQQLFVFFRQGVESGKHFVGRKVFQILIEPHQVLSHRSVGKGVGVDTSQQEVEGVTGKNPGVKAGFGCLHDYDLLRYRRPV